jgi:hypothetical protein
VAKWPRQLNELHHWMAQRGQSAESLAERIAKQNGGIGAERLAEILAGQPAEWIEAQAIATAMGLRPGHLWAFAPPEPELLPNQSPLPTATARTRYLRSWEQQKRDYKRGQRK